MNSFVAGVELWAMISSTGSGHDSSGSAVKDLGCTEGAKIRHEKVNNKLSVCQFPGHHLSAR